MAENELPSKIVDNAFNDYIRAFNAAVRAPRFHASPAEVKRARHLYTVPLEQARWRYAKALANHVIGGDPAWYVRGY